MTTFHYISHPPSIKPWLCACDFLLLYLRAVSSYFTSHTCFIWCHTACDLLWPKHISFESSPLCLLSPLLPFSSSLVPQNSAWRWDPLFHIFNRLQHKCTEWIAFFLCFLFLFFFLKKIPCSPLHSPTILISAFVPEFSSLRQIGPSIHYQRR